MHTRLWYIIGVIALILAAMACNLPTTVATPDLAATSIAATLSFVQTSAVISPTSSAATDTSTPTPTNSSLPAPAPTPENPLVINDTLCWAGPGNAYEVVSAIRKGTRVELLGRGSILGWWIVRNPIYRDPCWMVQADLQIDPAYNTSGLQIFYPPPTPTPTSTPVPTATP